MQLFKSLIQLFRKYVPGHQHTEPDSGLARTWALGRVEKSLLWAKVGIAGDSSHREPRGKRMPWG